MRLVLGIPAPSRLKNWPFFQKSGVRGSTLKWDLRLYCEIPPYILAELQDGAFAISATNCHPSKRSYQLLPYVLTSAQRGHLSTCANIETCGSMVSPWAIRAKKYAVEGGGWRRAQGAQRAPPSCHRASPTHPTMTGSGSSWQSHGPSPQTDNRNTALTSLATR